MILRYFFFYFFVGFCFTSCNKLKGPEKPKNLISKDKMVAVLIDAKLIGMANTTSDKRILRDSGINMSDYVYKRHHIDSLQFALSNNYYAFQVEVYEAIFDRVIDSLEKLEAKLKEKEADEWKKDTLKKPTPKHKPFGKSKTKNKKSLLNR